MQQFRELSVRFTKNPTTVENFGCPEHPVESTRNFHILSFYGSSDCAHDSRNRNKNNAKCVETLTLGNISRLTQLFPVCMRIRTPNFIRIPKIYLRNPSGWQIKKTESGNEKFQVYLNYLLRGGKRSRQKTVRSRESRAPDHQKASHRVSSVQKTNCTIHTGAKCWYTVPPDKRNTTFIQFFTFNTTNSSLYHCTFQNGVNSGWTWRRVYPNALPEGVFPKENSQLSTLTMLLPHVGDHWSLS